jgi:uncharacterized damage-inducible protein DinB
VDTLTLLDLERAALMSNVARVPEHDRSRRPAPDAWSVSEVLEHLATVERGIAKLLALRGRETPGADAPPAVPLDEARIAALRGRERRTEAPERVRPTGTVSCADALRALGETRDALRKAVVDATPAALDGCTHTHPVLGTLTLRDWVHFIAHHEARHAAQVAEIADALNNEIAP